MSTKSLKSLSILCFSLVALLTYSDAYASLDDSAGLSQFAVVHPNNLLSITVPAWAGSHLGQKSYSLGPHVVRTLRSIGISENPRVMECFVNLDVPYTNNLGLYNFNMSILSVSYAITNRSDGEPTGTYTLKGSYGYDGNDNNPYGVSMTCNVSQCLRLSHFNTDLGCIESSDASITEFLQYLFDADLHYSM